MSSSMTIANAPLSSVSAVLRTLGVEQKPPGDITGVAADSRRVEPGFLFVALPGRSHNGGDFVPQAIARGATAVVVEEGQQVAAAPGVRVLTVPNARSAWSAIAAALYAHPARSLRMTGVTGTNGKTSTSWMIAAALRRAGRKTGCLGTVGYQTASRHLTAALTTPEALDLHRMLAEMHRAGCRDAVMEVSSHALDQRRTEGIDYAVAVFTNLTRDHLDYHATMETYFEAKARLFDPVADAVPGATAVINVDDPWGRRLVDRCGKASSVVTFGHSSRAMVRAASIQGDPEGSAFLCHTPWGSESVRLPCPGRFQIDNALAAIASCAVLGIDLRQMTEALSCMGPVPGRMERVSVPAPFQVYVDYAHTDDALCHALRAARAWAAGRVVVVFGCGGDRDKAKRASMGRVASTWADRAILTSDNPRTESPADIAKQIAAGMGEGFSYDTVLDRRNAIFNALREGARGDVIVIAGKGHEQFQHVGVSRIAFDDRTVVRTYFGG